MPKIKIYKCYKCGKVLNYSKPIRFVQQEYKDEIGVYKQYYNVKKYDFCDRCYSVLKKWLNNSKN